MRLLKARSTEKVFVGSEQISAALVYNCRNRGTSVVDLLHGNSLVLPVCSVKPYTKRHGSKPANPREIRGHQ